MTASLKVRQLGKTFALARRGGRAVSLFEALRSRGSHVNVREVRALRDITFEIAEGERVGIIGANGAGKTTLLSILAGLTDCTTGSVEVEGDLHAMLTIGDVLREDLTGRENIYLDATVHGRDSEDIAAVVEQVIEFTELGDFIERPVNTYSSGMKARLAFSMGAFIDADILIIDETLSVGDVFFAKKASRRMKEVANRGSIVIMVTHSLATIVELCTRCLWLEGGRLTMDGDPVAVTRAYEESVRHTDEADLRRKFGSVASTARRDDIGSLDGVAIFQSGDRRQSTVTAMRPLTIEIRGTVRTAGCDLSLSLLRVDGRRIWLQRASDNGARLPPSGGFTLSVEMDPLILGADLYRLDVGLADGHELCDSATRVFEVIDEEGQYGGKPLLFHPPSITARPAKEIDR